MQRKFITNLILLLSLNLLIKPFWILGIDRSVQNVVGEEMYGFYFVVLNFSFLFNILLDLGITNFNNRNIAQHKHLLNKHFSGIVVVRVMLGLVYMAVTFLAALVYGFNSEQMGMLGWIALNQFLLASILYLRSNVSGLLMLRTDSLISVLDRLLMILFCSMLLWGNVTETPFRIEWFVYAQTAAYIITAIIALSIVVIKARFRKIYWHWPFFLMIVRRSLPFATLVMMMAFYNRIDPVLINKILPEPMGEIQAGIYAKGFRLFDAANQIAYLFAVLLLPIFSNQIQQKKDLVPIVRMSVSLLFTLSVTVAVTSWYFAPEIMNLLYPGENYEATRVFSILIFGFVAVSGIYIFGTLLTANGSLRQLNIIAALAIVVNLAINIILIPRIMAVGSAYASLSAQFLSMLLQLAVAQRIFRFRVDYHYLAALLLFLAGMFAGGYFIRKIQWEWYYEAFLLLGLSLILSLLLKLLNIRTFIQNFRERDQLGQEAG